ncbi:hypothetical protein SETIT_3G352200v2 [Setaria italica]|uniref:Uncharacterized protein n=2 Tax=Setaria TaxID=4554 RepID=A0A368QMD3_SETIT|nr:hypothetical protein SETIT_3G352200v2 [Setaria italica]TKW29019.1 hypothetical protein SEVIR_3G367900v2 [Setaria viridis]
MPSVVVYRNGPGAGDSFTTIAEIRVAKWMALAW